MSRRGRSGTRRGLRPGVVLVGAAITGAVMGVVLQQSGASLPGVLGGGGSPDEIDLDIHYTPPAIAPLDDVALPALDGLPAYPGSRPASLGTDIRTQSAPTAIAWFATSDPVDEVLAWYENTLNESGLPAFTHRFGPANGYVAYRRHATDSMHVVAVMREGDQTLVFPSVTQATSLVEARAEVPDDMPHPGSALHTSVIDMMDGGSRSTTVTGLVELSRMAELVAFYERELSAKGWHVDAAAMPLPGQARVEARRAGARFEVVLNELTQGGEYSAIQIVAMKRTQAPQR